MKPTQRKTARPAPPPPANDAVLPELEQAVEAVLAQSDALLTTDGAPSTEHEAIVRALAETSEHLAKLDEVHKARVVEVRRLRDLLRDQVLVAVRSAALTLKANSQEAVRATERIAQAELELAAARDQLADLQGKADALAKERDVLRTDRNSLAQRERALEAGIQAVKNEAARFETQLRDALGQATEAAMQLADTRHLADEAAAARDQLRVELDALKAERERERAAAHDAQQQHRLRAEELSARLQEAEAEVERATADVERLTSQLVESRQQSEAHTSAISEQHDSFIVSLTEEYDEKLVSVNSTRNSRPWPPHSRRPIPSWSSPST